LELNESFDVRPEKLKELRERIARLKIDLARISESFTRGGGKGGQKINKTSNRVVLRYAPLGLMVSSQRERRRTVNRFIALRELVDRIEMRVSPGTSGRLQEIGRIRKRKARRSQRASIKAALQAR